MTVSDAPATTVAVVQFAPGASPDENAATMRALTAEAVAQGARLVVFPEYSLHFSAPASTRWIEAAQPLDGPFAAAVGAIAAEFGVHVVAGLLERVEGGARCANTLAAFSPEGALVATYRKQHLYDAFGTRESEFVAPGDLDEPQTFVVDGVTVGMQTCYDLRFPEVTRRVVDAGADVVLVPAEWVPGPGKLHHWRTLLAARAIENTAYVVAADHPLPSGVGGSIVLDPAGVELATLGDDAGIAVAAVSRARVDEVRAVNPALALRRYAVVPR